MSQEQLLGEIAAAQQTVATDQYPMSIGELTSLYRDEEIILNPKFQRFYRWSLAQKSALVESILVGIPIPPIFCYEREDSKWEIIDGLQRVSTILEFMGLRKNPEGQLVPPTVLAATQYLPSLAGATWELDEEVAAPVAGQYEIAVSTQIAFKRAKLGIQIIKKTSAGTTKFDLFQRLNSNGSPLTAQEYRSCILVMINEALFDEVVAFAATEAFRGILRLDNENVERQDDIDSACRYLTHYAFEYEVRDKDVDEFISDSVKHIFLDRPADVPGMLQVGIEVVESLYRLFSGDALRRIQDGRPIGRVGRVGFELIVVGLAHNWADISALEDPDKFIHERVSAIWSQQEIADISSPGTRGTDRIRRTVPFGKQWFRP